MKKTNMSGKLKTAALAGLISAVVSGCTTYQPSFGPTQLRNKITVAETVERLELYVGQAGLHLSARDQDAVGDFIGQYSASGEGPLYVNIPANGSNSHGVAQANTVIKSLLVRYGIGGTTVQSGQYAAAPGAPAPVIVSFRRLTTVPIDCQQGASLTHTSNNQPYGNFGCAQTANLAALIDNPRQLLSPYPLDNASTIRRSTVLDNYNAGQATATPRPIGQEINSGGG